MEVFFYERLFFLVSFIILSIRWNLMILRSTLFLYPNDLKWDPDFDNHDLYFIIISPFH